LAFTVPSECADDLRAGRADVAIIPAIEYQRIPGLAILPDMAIASKHQVRSLLIVAKKPIEQVRTFALDSSSRSTQVLTRILCAEKWRIAPEFSEALPDLPEMLDIADAALIIGDPALRISLGIAKDGWPGAPGQTVCPAATLGITSCELLYVSDVVGEWRALTRRPAVLAVWALGRELATAELGADFLASRDFGLAHLGEISISIIPRRTNRARSSVTQSPHGRGPLLSECSTPSGTRCTLNNEWVSSTAAANGCSPRCLAACITLIRLGQSTWAARLSWRAFVSLNRGRSFVQSA